MRITATTRDKLRVAFKNQTQPEDKSLPVGYIHADRVPVRGSVHIGTGRVMSRLAIDRLFKKIFS
jgi:hypothetical protein